MMIRPSPGGYLSRQSSYLVNPIRLTCILTPFTYIHSNDDPMLLEQLLMGT
jgi:predicted alpha/beta-fold hydrolase